MGESPARSLWARVGFGAATFDALHNENYRWFWIGRVASQAALNMMRVAQGWLVYELTRSALSLSWVSSARSLVMLLLSLYGGVLCDRFDKRNLIMIARSGSVLTSLFIALMVITGQIQVWHLVAVSLFGGLMASFMMPARQSIIADLVDRETLLNAVSLNSIGMGLTGIFAASLAGYLIDRIGVQGVYLIMSLLYVANVWALSKLPMVGGTFKSDNSPLADIKELLSYLRRKPILIALLLLVLARAWFYMPYRTYMPKYSDDVLGFDATGLGLLLAAPSIGSLISSLIVASLGDFQGKGKLLIVAGFVTGLSLILWSNAAWFPLVFFGLMVMGAAGNATMVTNNTLMQTNSEPRLRGRVMSAYMMAWGLTPLSTIPLGALADKLGVSFVVTTMGVLLIVFFAGVLFWQSRIQKLP